MEGYKVFGPDWTFRDWLNSDARYLLNQIPRNFVKWINSDDMTDEEKEKHPEHKTIGGYLKTFDESESRQLWWDSLDENSKSVVTRLPNFDAEIFKKITGIEVR